MKKNGMLGKGGFALACALLVAAGFGIAGLIRSWVNNGCKEPAARMADMADAMIRQGSLNL